MANDLANLDAVDAAALLALRSAALPKLRPLGNEAIQIWGGRQEYAQTAAAAGDTQEFAVELMARSATAASAPRALHSQSRGGTSGAGAAASMAFVGALADLNGSVSWQSATWFGGSSATSVLNALSTARSYDVASDQAPIVGVARTDGGTKPLLAIRTFFGSGASAMMLMGATGQDMTNWASRPEGLVRVRQHNTAGNQIASLDWAANSAAISRSIVRGVAFTHDTPVVNVMSVGDSIPEARGGGITYLGASMGLRACEILNAEGRRCQFVHSNLGWSGQNSDQCIQRFEDILAWGIIPDVALWICGSPNDTPNLSDPITSTVTDKWRANTGKFLALCATYGIVPVLLTILPCDPAVHNWDATDALRRARNAEIVAMADQGIFVADISAALSGAVDGDGQTDLLNTTDGIHPNDAGIELEAAVIAPVLRTIAGGNL